MLGSADPLTWSQQGSDMRINLPSTLPGEYAYVLTIAVLYSDWKVDALFRQCDFNRRNCLRCLNLGSAFIEVNSIIVLIGVMHHEFVLIVNWQTRLLGECFRNRIS